MGSRKKQTTVYWLNDDIQVICGCFSGSLIKFKEKVLEKHGTNVYAKEYNDFIHIVETIIDMERKN